MTAGSRIENALEQCCFALFMEEEEEEEQEQEQQAREL